MATQGAGARSNRSTRLPSAPPNTNPSPKAQPELRSRGASRTIATTTPSAISDSSQVNPVAIENAAPEFR